MSLNHVPLALSSLPSLLRIPTTQRRSGESIEPRRVTKSSSQPAPLQHPRFVSALIIFPVSLYNTLRLQILKVSGVGPKEELESAGVPVVVDLPDVGEHLMDHITVGLIHRHVFLLSFMPAYSS